MGPFPELSSAPALWKGVTVNKRSNDVTLLNSDSNPDSNPDSKSSSLPGLPGDPEIVGDSLV